MIDVQFKPTYPNVIPAEDRPKYGDETIALKIETDTGLKDARVRSLVISKHHDLSHPLNGIVEPTFGWPLGDASFEPRFLGGVDYIVLASERKIGDHRHLKFFFNEFYDAPGPESKELPELAFLEDLEPGTYYLKIVLLAEGIAPIMKKFRLDFDPVSGTQLKGLD
jgi:hypothetical protein